MIARSWRHALRLASAVSLVAALSGPSLALAESSPCHALPDPQWPGQCYAPGQVKQAEKSLEVPPIPAKAVVESATHLRLKQLQILETEVPNSGVPQNYVLHYFFGTLPHDAQGAPVASRRTPHYVLVSEFAGTSGTQGTPITRDIGMLQAFHVPAGSGPLPWTLHTDVPTRHLTLYVTSNISAKTVKDIAAKLLAKGHARR